MAKVANEPDVFKYLDYRHYLRDYYTARKEAGRGFSYRVFSRRAGLKSPNHLKLVVDGDRRLTPKMVHRYADAIGLKGERAEYFGELVRFNEAATHAEKSAAHDRIVSFRGYRKVHQMGIHQAAYHAHWYIPAIRELVSHRDFSEDPKWIATTLLPKITTEEARRGIDTLLELGFVRRDSDGKMQQADPAVSTGAQAQGFFIAQYHLAMLEQAGRSIDLVPREDRDISALTFCVDEKMLADVQERIVRFRRELVAVLSAAEDGTCVYQLGMQLFPLASRSEATRSETKKGHKKS